MEYNFKNQVKVFMIFDILGDTVRSGPILWKINRKRLEDVKNHVTDLHLIVRILKKYLPNNLDYNIYYKSAIKAYIGNAKITIVADLPYEIDEDKSNISNGIYNKDPKQFEDAEFIPHTSYLDVLNKKLKVMDSTAISLCMEEEIPILVFNIHKPGNLHKLLLGEEIGSVVS